MPLPSLTEGVTNFDLDNARGQARFQNNFLGRELGPREVIAFMNGNVGEMLEAMGVDTSSIFFHVLPETLERLTHIIEESHFPDESAYTEGILTGSRVIVFQSEETDIYGDAIYHNITTGEMLAQLRLIRMGAEVESEYLNSLTQLESAVE